MPRTLLRHGTALLALAVIVLAGCGPEAEPPIADEPDPPADEPDPPADEPDPDPDEPDPEPALDPDDYEVHLAGATFQADAQLEGGCAWVETRDGTRYEVIWPDGYEVDFGQSALVGPDGQVVARSGEALDVGGAPDPDINTICQVGTVFDAEAVAAGP